MTQRVFITVTAVYNHTMIYQYWTSPGIIPRIGERLMIHTPAENSSRVIGYRIIDTLYWLNQTDPHNPGQKITLLVEPIDKDFMAGLG